MESDRNGPVSDLRPDIERAIAEHAKDRGWRRIGVYGLDYVMTVRDYRELEGFDVVPFDVEFDHARAVKSEAELASVKDSVRINQRGFELFADAYAPGRSAAEVMAAAEEYFVAEGCGRLTMNMVLTAPGRSGVAFPEFKIARKDEVLGDFVLPSLEIAGPGMHWVEVSRALAAPGAKLSPDTAAMAEAYTEYYEAAKSAMRFQGTLCFHPAAPCLGRSSRATQSSASARLANTSVMPTSSGPPSSAVWSSAGTWCTVAA